MHKFKNLPFSLLLFFLCARIALADPKATDQPQRSNSFVNSTLAAASDGNLARQFELQREAKRLENEGRYDEALEKYRQSTHPSLVEYEREKSVALGAIVNIYQLQGKYGLALEELGWFKRRNPKHLFYVSKKREIDAQIYYEKKGDKKLIYELISDIQNEHADRLPPKGWIVGSDMYISTILRLYDFIGDYDAGISYIDEVMVYSQNYDKAQGENYEIYNLIKTSEQAADCAGLNIFPVKNRRPEWRACKWIREYLLVREAFEKDKAEGTKGRATKALIQSDYFPW